MRFILVLLMVVYSLQAHASTLRYDSGILAVEYSNTNPDRALNYTPVGVPDDLGFMMEINVDLVPNSRIRDFAISATFGNFSLSRTSSLSSITTDENGDIVDWFLLVESFGGGGADFTRFGSTPDGDFFAYQYEYALTCLPLSCGGTGSERITALSTTAGNWSVVPLPSSGFLLLGGLLALSYHRMRFSANPA